MTADWTTCRVVRDHDGDLWSREGQGWNLVTFTSHSWCPDSEFLVGSFGPITPVLDADGLPVVTTGGDLTAGVGLLDRLDAAEAALKRVRELAEGPWTHACHDLDADCAACWAHDLLAIINPESEG